MPHLSICVVVGVVGASVTGPATDGAQPPPSDVLRGPTVTDDFDRTLVRVDFQGNFVRLPGRAEIAAIELLDLDPNERNAVDDVVRQRARTVDRMLLDRVDVIRDVTDAMSAEDADRARALMRDLHAELDPERSRTPLLESIAEALSPAQGAELHRLVDEYWTAWLDWELRRQDGDDERRRRQLTARLAFQLFQQETRQAYERTLRPFRNRLQGIYDAVDPTPEQRVELREIVITYIREAGLDGTQDQRDDVARKLYFALDEERRIKLVAHSLRGL